MVVLLLCFFFFFKQKTAYGMRISDWSSDVCSSDLQNRVPPALYSSLTWSVREAAGRDWRGDSGSGSCRDLDGWGFIAAKPRQFARDDRQTPGRPGGRADDQPFESGGQTHQRARASCRERVGEKVWDTGGAGH